MHILSLEIANINWTIIEVETTLALALCLAGIILCIVSLCEPCAAVSPRRWDVIAAGLMLASCKYYSLNSGVGGLWVEDLD